MIALSSITSLVTVLIFAAFLQLIQNVFVRVNDLDIEKSKKSISASIDAVLDQAKSLVADNARWDDAVSNSYGETNHEWLLDTFGVSAGEANGTEYDSTFIVGRDFETFAGFSNGEVSPLSAKDFFGYQLSALMAELIKTPGVFQTKATFSNTPNGLSIVAIAPIVSHTGQINIAPEETRFLIFSKKFTASAISNLADRLALHGLSFASEPNGQATSVKFPTADGSTVGYLTWSPDNPGDIAKSEIQWQALLAVAAMIACIAGLTWFSSRLSARLQKSESKAWKIANQDALTKLPNRYAATMQLETQLSAEFADRPAELTVMLADLDGFKDVNDTFGHQIGDELLQKIATGMAAITSQFSATISRLGGDEFAIIVSGDQSQQRAEGISEAALKFLSAPFDISGRIVKVGFSIGIATTETGKSNAIDILRCADVAMYTAKSRGKNQFCHYEPTLDTARNERIAMAKALAEALNNQQLKVAYQPIVDAKSHQITGVEALARWQMTNGQWAQPDIFISIAEEFGLIDALGDQVLTMACAAMKPFDELKLSVNISPAQFRNPNFVENCLAIIDRSGIPRKRMELEVTESYIIDHQEVSKPVIASLQAAGIDVSLDDFGTGYSSIGYLRAYKFNKLKIDKSLIEGMVDDEVARSIIQVTTVLARSMNMTVTAEGVEHEEEAHLLRLAGCDTLQGYYFGRPQSAASIGDLISVNHAKLAIA